MINAMFSYCVLAMTCFIYYLTEFFPDPYAQGVTFMNFIGDTDSLAIVFTLLF